MAKEIKLTGRLFTNDGLQKFYTQFLKDFGNNERLSFANVLAVAKNIKIFEDKLTEIKASAENVQGYEDLKQRQQKVYDGYIKANGVKGKLTDKDKANLKIHMDKVNKEFPEVIAELEKIDKAEFNLHIEKLKDTQGISPVIYLDYAEILF